MGISSSDLNRCIQWERRCSEYEATTLIINLRNAGSIKDSELGYVIREEGVREMWNEWVRRGEPGNDEGGTKGDVKGGEVEDRGVKGCEGNVKGCGLSREKKNKEREKERREERRDRERERERKEKEKSGGKYSGISAPELIKCIKWERSCTESEATGHILSLRNDGRIKDSSKGYTITEAGFLKEMWDEWKSK